MKKGKQGIALFMAAVLAVTPLSVSAQEVSGNGIESSEMVALSTDSSQQEEQLNIPSEKNSDTETKLLEDKVMKEQSDYQDSENHLSDNNQSELAVSENDQKQDMDTTSDQKSKSESDNDTDQSKEQNNSVSGNDTDQSKEQDTSVSGNSTDQSKEQDISGTMSIKSTS